MSAPDDPIAVLARWADAGAVWRVVDRRPAGVTAPGIDSAHSLVVVIAPVSASLIAVPVKFCSVGSTRCPRTTW